MPGINFTFGGCGGIRIPLGIAPPPTIESADTASIVEGNTSVMTVTASGGKTPYVFTISGGPDVTRFSIDSSTGVLSFNFVPDYADPQDADLNNVYQITVRVASVGGAYSEQTINVTVTNKFTSLISGLLSWYDLEDVLDAVGGRTLSNDNGSTFTSGKIGNAATFTNGSNQSLTYAGTIVSGGLNPFTVAGWVKSNTSTRWRIINLNDETFLLRDYTGITWQLYDNFYRSIPLASAADGTWMFTCLRYDPTIGTYGRFTFDLKYGATSLSGTYDPIATPQSLIRCKFGQINDGDADGQVDSVGLWNRVVTDNEVTLLWNSGNGIPYSRISS